MGPCVECPAYSKLPESLTGYNTGTSSGVKSANYRISSMDVRSSPSYTAPVRPKKLECPSFDNSEVTPFSWGCLLILECCSPYICIDYMLSLYMLSNLYTDCVHASSVNMFMNIIEIIISTFLYSAINIDAIHSEALKIQTIKMTYNWVQCIALLKIE